MVGWKGGTAGMVGWRAVVGRILFLLMGEEYLRNRVAGMVGGEDGEWMTGVVAEALRSKAARRDGAVLELELLERKAVVDRVRLGVRWEEYIEGGGCGWQGMVKM